ncbi:NAD(P)-binding domain-containing protein [Streptomyces sp. NPDC003077]|uniref:NAD(P)-binding domain-containing protein n=1 Tax=Streptomyces sp. NPDC003077 TaxID=3154443 RepID=UPI0033A5D8CA
MTYTFIPAPELLDSPRGRRLVGATPSALMVPERPELPPTASAVIVGGGLAALSLAARLWHDGIRDYLILERGPRLGGQFFERTASVGQMILRSPYEHHPGAEGHSDCEMLDFARLNWNHLTAIEQNEVRMAQSGQRAVAPLDVFEGFCSHVAATHSITERSRRAEVQKVVADGDGWRVATDRGDVRATAVVLAVGEARREAPDGWDTASERVRYWDEPCEPIDGRHAVIGAGLSAAHIVADLCARGLAVDWVFRGKEHYQCADVNAAFFRPEGRAIFHLDSLERRWAMLSVERRPSIMFEFRPRLRAWEEVGLLSVHRETVVTELRADPTGVALCIDGGAPLRVSQAHLALGTRPPLAPEVSGAEIRTHGGLPLMDETTLQISGITGLYAIGALASLALGPATRNIDGHRVAAARISTSLRRRLGSREA